MGEPAHLPYAPDLYRRICNIIVVDLDVNYTACADCVGSWVSLMLNLVPAVEAGRSEVG